MALFITDGSQLLFGNDKTVWELFLQHKPTGFILHFRDHEGDWEVDYITTDLTPNQIDLGIRSGIKF